MPPPVGLVPEPFSWLSLIVELLIEVIALVKIPPPLPFVVVLEFPVIVEFVIVSVAAAPVLANRPAPGPVVPLPPVRVTASSVSEPRVPRTRLLAHVWTIVAPFPLTVSGVAPWLSAVVAATIAARKEPAPPSTVGSGLGVKVAADAEGAATNTAAAA